MSNAFDRALINREKNRQQLADVLEEKYSSERRNAAIFRLFFVASVLGVSFFLFRTGLNSMPDFSKMALYPKKKSGSKEILEQMQRQMKNESQLMIGSENEEKKDLAKGNRSKGIGQREIQPLSIKKKYPST